MRLINADALLEKLRKTDRYFMVKFDIENEPTVAERPTGEWITVHFARNELNCPEKSMLDFVKCPFCETIHQGRHNFCSRCGADMRGEEE